MRTAISITQISILEQDISVKAVCHKTPSELKSGLLCMLQTATGEHIGKIASLTQNDSKTSLNIKIPCETDDYIIAAIRSLLPYRYNDKKELPLLVEEKANPEIAKEVQLLLYTLSQKTGKKKEDILWEKTAYKPGAGRSDLRFVSEKAMFVIRDKMKEDLSEAQPLNSPQEANIK